MNDASRTIVKVCGLTRIEDARAAAAAGADWLGFVVHGESPRRIAPARVAEIAAALPHVTIVAVMVAPTPEEALAAAEEARARRVQIHRPPASGWPADFPLPAAVVVPVDEAGRAAAPMPDARHLLMLDTAHPDLAGGTGETLPWSVAAELARGRAIMLAGGLHGGNVASAILSVRPFAVDASSRLERAPGVKDHELVRRFVEAARACDRARAERSA